MIADKLKQAILQAAIQGKLTEQLPSDGDARDLVKQIKAEKDKLIKEGKIKKEKPLPGITEDEIPFEIPGNWCWVRLGNITNKLTDGSHNPPPNSGSGYPVISAMCIDNDEVNLSLVKRFTDETGFNKENRRTNICYGDIVLGIIGGSIGNLAKYNSHKKVIAQRSIAIINSLVNNDYLYTVLKSPLLQTSLRHTTGGTAQGGVYLGDLQKLIIPLPPLAEQQRIVERINALLPDLEKLHKEEAQLETLQQAFPKKMKDSLLQSAIQGKLTEQLASDGDARDLVKQIKVEKDKLIKEGKIKKEKLLPEITEDEIPFEIPRNWCWVRLGNISEIKGGKRIPVGQKLTISNTGHKYIRVADMHNGSVLDNDLHYVPKDVYPIIRNYIINSDDIYITCAGTIGRVGTVPVEFDGANLTENADKIVFHFLNKMWLFYSLSSDALQSQVKNSTTKVGQPKLAIKRIESLILPLPPLTEQQRIVERLEQLLPLCDKLN